MANEYHAPKIQPSIFGTFERGPITFSNLEILKKDFRVQKLLFIGFVFAIKRRKPRAYPRIRFYEKSKSRHSAVVLKFFMYGVFESMLVFGQYYPWLP